MFHSALENASCRRLPDFIVDQFSLDLQAHIREVMAHEQPFKIDWVSDALRVP